MSEFDQGKQFGELAYRVQLLEDRVSSLMDILQQEAKNKPVEDAQ